MRSKIQYQMLYLLIFFMYLNSVKSAIIPTEKVHQITGTSDIISIPLQ